MACRYIEDPLLVSATDIDVQESLVTEGGRRELARIWRRQRKAHIGATKGAAQLESSCWIPSAGGGCASTFSIRVAYIATGNGVVLVVLRNGG